MRRFVVIAKEVKYKGKMYLVGDYLPPRFTEKERFRQLYPSRIKAVEVPDNFVEPTRQAELPDEGIKSAEIPSTPSKPPTGTPKAQPKGLSGKTVK